MKMEKYTSLYVKNRAALCFGLALGASVIVLIIALLFNITPHDVLFSLVPLGIGVLAFLVCLLKSAAFKSYVKKQGVPFNDKNSHPLFQGSEVHLSESWLIVPGSFAAPRENIKKVSAGLRKSAKGEEHSVSVITTDGRFHSFSVDTASSAKKVVSWANREEKQPKKK